MCYYLLPRPPDDDDEGKTYADHLRDKMEKIHDLARHNVKAANDRQKANYDKRAIIRPYKAGDMVWLQNHATKKGLSPKLRQHWIGPYKILNKLSDVTYRIKKEPIGKPKVVHHNRLKPYCERLKPKAVSRKKSSAKTEAREMYPTFLRQRRPQRDMDMINSSWRPTKRKLWRILRVRAPCHLFCNIEEH